MKNILILIIFISFGVLNAQTFVDSLGTILDPLAIGQNDYKRTLFVSNSGNLNIIRVKIVVNLENEVGSNRLEFNALSPNYLTNSAICTPQLTTSFISGIYTLELTGSNISNFLDESASPFPDGIFDQNEQLKLSFLETGINCSVGVDVNSTTYTTTCYFSNGDSLTRTLSKNINVPSPSIYTGGVSLNEHLFQMQCTFIPDSSFWSPDSAAPNDLRFVYKNINKLF